jgi:predicted ATPase
VDLAPLTDPALIPQAVAAALQVQEEPGLSLLATLQRYLHSRTLLLLLDNCEHLLGACADLANSLLQSASGVRILAASRQSLGLAGEVSWQVPTLSTPLLSDLPSQGKPPQKDGMSLLQDYDAVQLFVVRAQQALPSFRITPQNAETVARICTHLDGLPLALELAAARVPSLSVEEIHSKIRDRFRLLTRGSRAALPRQKTLRALLDWSYDLLSADEKTLLCRLSVFVEGWTLQAAERLLKRGKSWIC